MGCGELLIGQLEFYWDFHLRPRLEGLTDDEYLWAPAEPSWTVHPDADGKIVMDQESPEPSPPPITTIAWRLVHIGVGCFAIRASTFFGDGSVPDDADMFDPRHIPSALPGTADAGLAFLDYWYGRWHDGIKALDEEALNRPLGPKGNQFADDSMLALITHVNREVMHHGAEICLLPRSLPSWIGEEMSTAFDLHVVFDCADPDRIARFWMAALGGYDFPFGVPEGFGSWDEWADANGIPEDQRNVGRTLVDQERDRPDIFFLKVPESKAVKNRVHLDIKVAPGLDGEARRTRIEAEAERLIALGASVAVRMDSPEGFHLVMQDPEGNEFCLA